MKVFKDSEKREWVITVNVGTAKAVRDLTQVDLFNLYGEEAGKVFNDPVLLVNVLYVLCRKQCEDRKMTDEEFGVAMYGDAIEDAARALLGAVADFFPSSRASILRKALEKSEQAAKLAEENALRQLENLDPTTFAKPTKSQAS